MLRNLHMGHQFWLSVNLVNVSTSEFEATARGSKRFTGVTVKRFTYCTARAEDTFVGALYHA